MNFRELTMLPGEFGWIESIDQYLSGNWVLICYLPPIKGTIISF